MKKYKQTKAGKKSSKKYWQSEAGKAAHKKAASKYWKTETGKASQKKSGAKHREAFPEKEKAHYAVRHALKMGWLFKKPCPCGEMEVESHHKSYEEDKWIDVDWLCKKCHAKVKKI